MQSTILIEWRSEYSVQIPSIDEQHKKLVNMINALNAAMESGLTDSLLESIFEGLLQYTQKHFAYEEALFEQTGYLAGAAHRREHDVLREQVFDLKRRLDRGEMVLGVEVMAFLRDWLTSHIMGSDRAYSKHLVEAGIR
jgi:hemerythrin